MSRLALVALVFLGPPVLYVLLLTARGQLRRLRRRQQKVSVAELVDRITRERAATAEQTDPLRRQPSLPPGWTWPSRDPDPPATRAPPLRARPYLQRARRALPDDTTDQFRRPT